MDAGVPTLVLGNVLQVTLTAEPLLQLLTPFFDSVVLYGLGWPQTHKPPAHAL